MYGQTVKYYGSVVPQLKYKIVLIRSATAWVEARSDEGHHEEMSNAVPAVELLCDIKHGERLHFPLKESPLKQC